MVQTYMPITGGSGRLSSEPERGKTTQQNKMSHCSTWREEGTKCPTHWHLVWRLYEELERTNRIQFIQCKKIRTLVQDSFFLIKLKWRKICWIREPHMNRWCFSELSGEISFHFLVYLLYFNLPHLCVDWYSHWARPTPIKGSTSLLILYM